MVTLQGSHLSFKKCTMKTNVSIPTIDIHKSKFILQKFQYSKIEMYLFLAFSTILSKVSLTKAHLDGNLRRGFYFINNFLK